MGALLNTRCYHNFWCNHYFFFIIQFNTDWFPMITTFLVLFFGVCCWYSLESLIKLSHCVLYKVSSFLILLFFHHLFLGLFVKGFLLFSHHGLLACSLFVLVWIIIRIRCLMLRNDRHRAFIRVLTRQFFVCWRTNFERILQWLRIDPHKIGNYFVDEAEIYA